ncbi:MAG: hypothetical protein GX556_00545 [Fibrobacter sp.]|nr:hypothetical protein [Fibrobacter sp.]
MKNIQFKLIALICLSILYESKAELDYDSLVNTKPVFMRCKRINQIAIYTKLPIYLHIELENTWPEYEHRNQSPDSYKKRPEVEIRYYLKGTSKNMLQRPILLRS